MAADPVLLAQARRALDERTYADGTAHVKSTKLKLAEELARLAGHTSLYPLTEGAVTDVAAALLAGNYRSAASYLGELKLHHVELDHRVGPALGRKLQKINDACSRGQGPP